MTLWAVFSDRHTEVDIAGDRTGLRALASAVSSSDVCRLDLDEPHPNWLVATSAHPLASILVEPSDHPSARIVFSRDGEALVISGRSDELERIVGGAITQLGRGPLRINTVGAHVHLDPTSDPEHRYYGLDSISLVVGIDGGADDV
jgi:hypothetical protein